jgi:type II secretory pathway component PulM
MNSVSPTRERRVKGILMVCCALILFVLGLWLLVEPLQAHGRDLIDNVDAYSYRA